MSYFNYHIGTHLLRPATITSNITYTPNGTTSPLVLTPNVAETSVITSPIDGNSINTNFFNLAVAVTDLTYKAANLESYSNDAESINFGFVNYNGRQEKNGDFYGGYPFVLSGTTSFTLPYNMDITNTKAFKMAAMEGILYTVTGEIDTTNSRFRPIIFGEAGNGSPFATTSTLTTYMNSKLKFSSNDGTNTFTITGNGNPIPPWASEFGTISSSNPKSFYIFWNDGLTQYSNSLTVTDSSGFINLISTGNRVGAKCTLSSPLGSATLSNLQIIIQNLLSVAIGNSNTFIVSQYPSGSPTDLQLNISADRTQNGIFQVSFQKDVTGDGNGGILDWLGWLNNVAKTTNPETLPSYTSEAYDYSSLFQFTTSGTGPYYLSITGQQVYFKTSFIDGYTSYTTLLSSFGLSTSTVVYYHSCRPLTWYSKDLNYGGDFWTGTINTTGNATIAGNLTVLGTINASLTNTSYTLPSYISNSSFELNTTNLLTPLGWIPYANTSATSTPTSGGLGTTLTFTVTPGGSPAIGTIYVNGYEYNITSVFADVIATQISQIIQEGYAFTYAGSGKVAISTTGNYNTPTIVLGTAIDITFPSTQDYGTPSPLVTLLANTTSPLFGAYDVILSKDAINRQGQGYSTPFTIDRGSIGQPFQISFFYVTSSNYASSDVGVFVYDVTNSILIPLSVSSIPASPSATLFTASFYPSTSVNYRFILHIASGNASAWTFRFDNVSVNPQNPYLTIATAISGWSLYPLTIGATTTAPAKATTTTTDIAQWRRIGSDMEITYHYTATTLTGSTAGTGTYLYPLPSGYTVDTTKIGSANLGYTVGYAHVTAAATQVLGEVEFNSTLSPSSVFVELPTVSGANLQNISLPQSATLYNMTVATEIHLVFKVPIAQWTTQTNLITDFMEYASNTSTTDAADTTLFYNGKDGSSFPVALSAQRLKRIQFVRPIQITDKIEIEVYDSTLGTWMSMYSNSKGSIAFVNQNTITYGMYYQYVTGSLTQLDVAFCQYARPTGATYGIAGEAWTGYNDGSGSTTIRRWRIRKTSNGNTAEFPSIVRAEYTETSAAAIETSAARLNFNVKVEDTHSAVTTGASTWAFLASVPGEYRITIFGETASNTPSAGDNLIFDLYLNGSQYRRIGKAFAYAALAAPTDFNFATSLRMNTGDSFYIQLTKTGYAINWATSAGVGPLLPRIIITRTGN